MNKKHAGVIGSITILFAGMASLKAYANSPAPVNYRDYIAGTVVIVILIILFNALVELAVAGLMKAEYKRVVFFTNIVTNMSMNILLGYMEFTFDLYLEGYYFGLMCILEILVLVTEYRLYCFFTKGEVPKKSILEYTVAANAVSFLLGLLVLHWIGLGVF